MRLTIVGNSGSYPGPESPASCYLLEADGPDPQTGQVRCWRILLDLGSGALGALHRHVDPLSIDAVFLSHLHADHCLDLCGFYVMRKYHPSGPQPRIPVYGPVDTDRRMARGYDLAEKPGMAEEFDFRLYPGGPFQLGPFSITAAEVTHPVTAYGLRVEANGRTLAYSGDTSQCAALTELARDVDMFLCEASFLDGAGDPPGVHLTGSEAAAVSQRAGAAALLLTHIPPWHDSEQVLADARTVRTDQVALARAGQCYQV